MLAHDAIVLALERAQRERQRAAVRYPVRPRHRIIRIHMQCCARKSLARAYPCLVATGYFGSRRRRILDLLYLRRMIDDIALGHAGVLVVGLARSL